jgi:hypothetical protein
MVISMPLGVCTAVGAEAAAAFDFAFGIRQCFSFEI